MDDELKKNKSLQNNQRQLVGRPKLAKSNKREWQDNKPVEENESGSRKRERPQYFNWKCYDNFDKVPDEKLFYDCKTIKLTERQRALAGKEILKVREKYVKLIQEWYEEVNGTNKTHLTVAGGNYTFFFVLPSMIKWIRERHPFTGVHIKLDEANELTEKSADIQLDGFIDEAKVNFSHFEKCGYVYSRKRVMDRLHFVTSNESMDVFGNKQNVLKNQDIILVRVYSQDLDNDISDQYQVVPTDRKGVLPRVIVDQYFLVHKMLLRSIGLGFIFSSMKLNKGITILEDGFNLARFFLIKKQLSKKYKWIGRRLLSSIKLKERK